MISSLLTPPSPALVLDLAAARRLVIDFHRSEVSKERRDVRDESDVTMPAGCVRCGAVIVPGARFCRGCGAEVPVPSVPQSPDAAASASASGCPACAAALVPGARFCRGCGLDLQALPAAPVTAIMPAAPPIPQRPSASLPYDPGAAPPEPRHGRRRRPSLLLVVGVLTVLGAGGAAAVVLTGSGDPVADKRITQTSALRDGGGASATVGRAQTTAPGPQVTVGKPAPTAGVPAGSDDELAQDIAAVLMNFHRAIVNRDFRLAWRLLSTRKRTQITREDGYAAWRSAQSSLTPWLHPEGLSVQVADLDRTTGVARVDVSGMSWSRPRASCSEWSGLTWVKYERGAWHYDPGYSTTPQRQRDWKSQFRKLLGGSC